MFIALSPPFTASMDIDREVLQQYLEKLGIPETEFRKSASQIGLMLGAILNDSIEEYISHGPSPEGVGQENLDDDENRKRGAIECVRNQIYDDHLQKRYDLKKSSKAPSFTDIDWDIKVKHFDAKLADFTPVPYATCRLSFQREFDDSPFALFGGRTFDAVQINFSVDEIDYLTRVLSRVKERLQAMESEGS